MYVELLAMGDSSSWLIKMYDGTIRHQHLPNRLRDYIEDNEHRDMDCIALGPCSAWFVSFADGTQDCGGSLSKHCKKALRRTASYVTLGRNQSFYVRYPDGTQTYGNVPDDLDVALSDAEQDGCEVEQVSLGWHKNDYFLRLEDGSTELSSSCDSVSGRIEKGLSHISRVVFGSGGHYFAEGFPYGRGSTTWVWDLPSGLQDALRHERDVITIDPSVVRFLHDSLSWRFREYSSTGETVYKLAGELAAGSLDASDIPPIRVVRFTNHRGESELWGLDHRRLWAFKAAGVSSVEAQLVHELPSSFAEQRQAALASPGRGYSITVRTQSRFRR